MDKYLAGAFAFALLLSTNFSFVFLQDVNEIKQTSEGRLLGLLHMLQDG